MKRLVAHDQPFLYFFWLLSVYRLYTTLFFSLILIRSADRFDAALHFVLLFILYVYNTGYLIVDGQYIQWDGMGRWHSKICDGFWFFLVMHIAMVVFWGLIPLCLARVVNSVHMVIYLVYILNPWSCLLMQYQAESVVYWIKYSRSQINHNSRYSNNK